MWQILSDRNKNPTRLSNKTNNAWSCAEDQILENSNLRNMILNICNERISKTLSVNLFTCKGTFLTDWVGRMIRWKCVVQGLYQLRKGTSAGRAFTYFYTIHRGGRIDQVEISLEQHFKYSKLYWTICKILFEIHTLVKANKQLIGSGGYRAGSPDPCKFFLLFETWGIEIFYPWHVWGIGWLGVSPRIKFFL